MTSQVDGVIGDDDQVESAGWNRLLTARAEILLHCLIGLNRVDGHPEKIAHATTPNVATIATTTMTMSTTVFRCSLKGLNPTPRR